MLELLDESSLRLLDESSLMKETESSNVETLGVLNGIAVLVEMELTGFTPIELAGRSSISKAFAAVTAPPASSPMPSADPAPIAIQRFFAVILGFMVSPGSW
jgi:hypothetical protein